MDKDRIVNKIVKQPTARWNIKETEFIIRLLNGTTIPGVDVEQAISVKRKFKMLHEALLKNEVSL